MDVGLHLHDAAGPASRCAAGLSDGLAAAAGSRSHDALAVWRVDPRTALANIVSQWLFAVYVELRRQGVENGSASSVHGGDDHGLQAGRIPQFAVVLEVLGRLPSNFATSVAAAPRWSLTTSHRAMHSNSPALEVALRSTMPYQPQPTTPILIFGAPARPRPKRSGIRDGSACHSPDSGKASAGISEFGQPLDVVESAGGADADGGGDADRTGISLTVCISSVDNLHTRSATPAAQSSMAIASCLTAAASKRRRGSVC